MKGLVHSVIILICLITAVSSFANEDFVPVRFDNCGTQGQQPNVVVGQSYTFSQAEVDADIDQRTVAFDSDAVIIRYEKLDPASRYALKVVYCTEKNQARTQTLFANEIQIHPAISLPQGKAQAFIYDIPKEVLDDGTIQLSFKTQSNNNAVVSQVWLLSDKPQPALVITAEQLPMQTVKISVKKNVQFTPVENAVVKILGKKGAVTQKKTDNTGTATFKLTDEILQDIERNFVVTSVLGDLETQTIIPLDPLVNFKKPTLTPSPQKLNSTKTVKLDLNGTWRFNPAPPEKFWTLDHDSFTDWSNINVPGEWVMQGFTVAKNAAAGYQRSFTVLKDWNDKRIKLRCDAVYSDVKVWVNGQFAGYHQCGFTPFELDVTEFIKTGSKNHIAMAVTNESLADTLASGTQYAAHQMGGITRKIYLFAVPQLNISSMHVETVFDENYDNATMRVCLDLTNQSDRKTKNTFVEFVLKENSTNNKVKLKESKFALPDINPGQKVTKIIEVPVKSPKKWDCEHPNLYRLSCSLLNNKTSMEMIEKRFGFRQVEIRNNQLFVNNSPIKLHGVNRHEAHPLSGRTLNAELWRKDAELFRAGNCNYIRTSHYPPAEEFIDICDELGLFVEQEAPLCWVGHGANANWQSKDPHALTNQDIIIQVTAEMIERDRSHPSVIIWSLANESAWGPNFEKSFEVANMLDPTKPKSFHDQSWGGYNNNGSRTQIANYHYPGPGGPERAANSERPLLFGEYCHLNCYNRREILADPGVRDDWGRGFAPMWENMLGSKGCLGGAIWSGISDAFHLPSGQIVGYGYWGPIDGWRRCKPEYWHMKKAYSPVRINPAALQNLINTDVIEVPVSNRYDFTNLNELEITWEVGGKTGVAKTDVEPRSEGIIRIKAGNLPDAQQLRGKALTLNFYDKARGFMVDTYKLQIGEIEVEKAPAFSGKPELSETAESYVISVETKDYGNAAEFKWVIDKKSGQIIDGRLGGEKIVVNGPKMMILPVNGEGGTQMDGSEYEPYTPVLSNWAVEKVAAEVNDQGVQVIVSGEYTEATGSYTMVFDGSGQVRIDYEFEAKVDINPRQAGVVVDVVSACDTLSWKRKGQWTVYPEDHIGRCEGKVRAYGTGGVQEPVRHGVAPVGSWSEDMAGLGSNDFRSTKRNVYSASLTSVEGTGLKVYSDGSQSVRAYVDGGYIRWLIAEYSGGGSDRFFNSHHAVERRPIKAGEKVRGSVRFELVKGE